MARDRGFVWLNCWMHFLSSSVNREFDLHLEAFLSIFHHVVGNTPESEMPCRSILLGGHDLSSNFTLVRSLQ